MSLLGVSSLQNLYYYLFYRQDRAFRKYLKLEGIPGIFVNFEENEPGVCLKEPVKNVKDLIDASRSEILAYLKKQHQDSNFNDKENHPKSSPKKVNGVRNSLPQGDVESECDKLLMCSANPQNCIVHSDSKKTQRWLYFHDQHQIDELINSLNKRGAREEELIRTLQDEKDLLIDIIQKTPVVQLNPLISDEVIDQKQKLRKPTKSRYEDANLGFPADANLSEILESTLIDYILEMEEKLFAGNLGSLKIKDRAAWRECLLKRNYNDLDKTLVTFENGEEMPQNNEGESIRHIFKARFKIIYFYKLICFFSDSESRSCTPDSAISDDFPDPGKYLGQIDTKQNESDDENREPLKHPDNVQNAFSSLAIALVQVARSVEPKYLKKPLGQADKKEGKREKMNVLDKWEQSLLASTSFSQIFLHYETLDGCVMWSRSALLARCRICKKQRDSENMLLCDSCNHGHHMYCLTPKLKAVPPGTWYCDKCLKQKELEEKANNPEPVKKRRRIFRDEDVDEEEEEIKQEIKEEVKKKKRIFRDEDVDDGEEEFKQEIKEEVKKKKRIFRDEDVGDEEEDEKHVVHMPEQGEEHEQEEEESEDESHENG